MIPREKKFETEGMIVEVAADGRDGEAVVAVHGVPVGHPILQAAVPGNTQVNGRPVKDMQDIRTGDIILIGDTALMVHLKGVKKV